jgi:hypothetical protein
MKKKHRNITVEGVQYAWSIGGNDYDIGSTKVNIWRDKKIIISASLFDEEITPKQIADIIKARII